MVELHHIYAALFAVAAAIAFALTAVAWRHRATRGARPLALLMLGIVIWAGASAVMWSVPTRPEQVFWLRMMSFGTWMVPVGFLNLALDVARIDRWRTPGRIALIAIPPFLLAVIEWLNPGRLYDRAFMGLAVGSHTHYASVPGPLYWAFTMFAYAMIVLGLVIIIRVHRRSSGTERARTTILLIGAIVPFVASIVSESRLLPLSGLDLAPLAFLVTGTLWLAALSRGQLLDILPVARDALVEQMPDGVVVLDDRDRVADANPAALNILDVTRPAPVGQPAEILLGGVTDAVFSLRESVAGGGEKRGDAAVPIGCQDDCRYVDFRVTALDTGPRTRPAHLVVLHDVTEERESKRLLETAHAELERNHRLIVALNEKLQEQAIRDPLTTLYNRRFLEDSLPREMARAEREEASLAFLLLDIDDFKLINDSYSHSAGDAALKMVSEVLLSGARVADIACRYGGDEFLVVMVNADTDIAHARSNDLRKRIEERRVVWDQGEFSITVSIGVSSVPASGITAEDGIAAADAALYRAKEAGRNRTVAALDRKGSWGTTGEDVAS